MKKVSFAYFSTRGFTLIELLVVISIIGLLSSVVLASLTTAREKGRIGSARYFDAQVQHIAGDALVGSWNFNECSGTTATDLSGYNNTGTLTNGPTWSIDTPTGTGCAVALDGVNDHVLVSDSASLRLATDFTVSMWVKNRSASAKAFLSKGVNTPSLSYGYNSLGFTFSSWNLSNSPGVPVTANDIDKWNHIVGVVSGSSRTLYVNGVKTDPSSTGASSWNNSNSLSIGANLSSPNYANAIIDDVRIFGKTLTAGEVGKLYATERDANKSFAKR